jgi:hypothetical protein
MVSYCHASSKTSMKAENRLWLNNHCRAVFTGEEMAFLHRTDILSTLGKSWPASWEEEDPSSS